MTLESDADTDENCREAPEQRPPTDAEVAALRRIVDDVLKRRS